MPASSPVRRGLLVAVLLLAGNPARGAELIHYVPANSDIVASVDLRGLLDAPLVKRYAPTVAQRYFLPVMKTLLEDSEAGRQFLKRHEEAVTRTVQDPAEVRKRLEAVRKQLSTVLVAGKLDGDEEEVLFLFECSVDADEFAELVRGIQLYSGKEVKAAESSGKRYYEIALPGMEVSLFLALLEKGAVLVTPNKAYAEEALATAAGKRKQALGKDLQELLDRVDRKQAAWMVAIEKEEGVRIEAGLTVRENVVFRAVLTASDAAAARTRAASIEEDVKNLIAFADAVAIVYKDLSPLTERLRTLKPDVKENRVILEWTLDDKVISEALKAPRE